jgi:hypothetical protein
MPKLSAHEKSIAEFFSNNTYFVPIYQRDFSWTEMQINALLEDLLEFSRRSDDGDSDYLLGQIVVTPGDGPNGEQWQLIDGQQRSTSVLLLLTALYHRMKLIPVEEVTDNIQFKREQLSGLLRFPGRNGIPTSRVRVAKSGESIVSKLISGQNPGEPTGKTQSNLIDAYALISRTISDELVTTSEVESFFDKITTHVWLVRLELSSAALALEVFEKINTRGLDLDNADLIKNRIFIEVSDSYFDEASEYWLQASSELFSLKKKKLKTIDFLLRAILISETGIPMTNSTVLDGWMKRITNDSEAREFVELLPVRAKELGFLAEGKTTNGKHLGELAGTTYFGFLQHLPLLLSGRKLAEDQSTEAYCRLARMVEDRSIASLLARERTGDFERMVPQWANKIQLLGNDIEAIIQASQGIRDQVVELLNRAEAQLHTLDYSNAADNKRIRYILARASRRVELDAKGVGVPELSSFLTATKKVRNRENRGFDIDHIYPKSKIDEFPKSNLLGNLVLLHPSDNRGAGNSSPNEKAIYYKTSELLINKALLLIENKDLNPRQRPAFKQVREEAPVNLEEWNELAVSQRANMYWKLTCEDILESF